MFRARTFHRLFAWIALVAVLGGALVPTVTRAMSAGQTTWLEICTAQSVKRVAIEDGSIKSSSPSHDVFAEHCHMCVPGFGSLGLAPLTQLSFALPQEPARFFPPLYFSAPQQLHAWAASNPRAPPVLSA